MTPTMNRRTLLKSMGYAGVAVGASLAGCTDSTSETDDSGSDETATPDNSGSGEEWVETDTVDMTDDLGFDPVRISVSPGTTVTWKTVGAVGHTVTAYEDKIPDGAEYFASGGFDTQDAASDGYPDEGNITEGGTYEHTFETEGTYEYYCIPHEMNGMIGYVKVE